MNICNKLNWLTLQIDIQNTELQLVWLYLPLIRADLVAPSVNLGFSYDNIAVAHFYLKNLAKANEYQIKALNILEKVLDSTDFHLSITYSNVAANYKALGDTQKALEFKEKAINVLRANPNSDPLDLAESLNAIAFIHEEINEYHIALDYLLEVEIIHELVLESDDLNLVNTYMSIAFVYLNLNNVLKASIYKDKAQESLNLIPQSKISDEQETFSILKEAIDSKKN